MKQFLIDGNIDWKVLRKQKEDLLAIRSRFTDKGASEVEKKEAESISGIIHLIDNIQDNAVMSNIFTVKQVFGKL